MNDPKVSIIIPVYNGANYLREAIQSAIAQTYQNLEIIVVNDGSDDDQTESIAKGFGERIVYLKKDNGGVASALNLGIQKMKGEYFSWLSHDDLYYSNKIEVQMQYLRKYDDDIIITYCDFEIIDGKSKSYGVKRIRPVPSTQFRYFITKNTSVHGCTFLIPKICFDECGLFNENLKTTQDYDMWFRLARKYKIEHIDNVLVKARYHSDQGTLKLESIAKEELNDLMIRQLCNLSPEEITQATRMPLCLSYAYIARNFEYRGATRAKYHALKLVDEKKDGLSLLAKIILYNVIYTQLPIARLLNFIRRNIVFYIR